MVSKILVGFVEALGFSGPTRNINPEGLLSSAMVSLIASSSDPKYGFSSVSMGNKGRKSEKSKTFFAVWIFFIKKTQQMLSITTCNTQCVCFLSWRVLCLCFFGLCNFFVLTADLDMIRSITELTDWFFSFSACFCSNSKTFLKKQQDKSRN